MSASALWALRCHLLLPPKEGLKGLSAPPGEREMGVSSSSSSVRSHSCRLTGGGGEQLSKMSDCLRSACLSSPGWRLQKGSSVLIPFFVPPGTTAHVAMRCQGSLSLKPLLRVAVPSQPFRRCMAFGSWR